jgi:hypothetical protein
MVLRMAIEDGVFRAAIEVGLRCRLVLDLRNLLCPAKDAEKDRRGRKVEGLSR